MKEKENKKEKLKKKAKKEKERNTTAGIMRAGKRDRRRDETRELR